jgi:hypothetical protein
LPIYLKLQNLGPDRRADRTQAKTKSLLGQARAGSNHKLQINIKLQCPNEQNQFIFGILDFFIGICLLFGIYHLVLFKHHEITLLINILPKMVKKRSLRN